MHQFASTLDIVPRNWYVKLELQRGTENWTEMVEHFITTFSFKDDCPFIDEALQITRENIFEEVTLPVYHHPAWVVQLEHALE